MTNIQIVNEKTLEEFLKEEQGRSEYVTLGDLFDEVELQTRKIVGKWQRQNKIIDVTECKNKQIQWISYPDTLKRLLAQTVPAP